MEGIVCVNTDKSENLINIIGDKNAIKIINYIQQNGYIVKKEVIKQILGKKEYDKFKINLYIEPPSSLLKIDDAYLFLTKLSKFNDCEVNSKICKKVMEIQKSPKSYGYIYILRRDEDKYTKWYKVGMTNREPEVRAKEWGYKLLYFAITSNHKKFERLIHLFLNYAHNKRKAIHGKGKYEVEWFHIRFDLIKKTIENVIEMYDDQYDRFTQSNIKRIRDL